MMDPGLLWINEGDLGRRQGCSALKERDKQQFLSRDSMIQWKGLQSGTPGRLGSHPSGNPGWLDCIGFTFFPWVRNREADTDSPSESAVKAIDEKCSG